VQGSSILFRIPVVVAICSLWCSPAFSQPVSEREPVLQALALSYGQSLDEKSPQFLLKPDHVLTPTFSDDGLLTAISIEPRSRRDLTHVSKLTRSEFDSVLATLTSVKSLGAMEEEVGGKTRSGWRVHIIARYHSAYLETEELMGYGEPSPIESAQIYYLHPVTGVPKIRRDEDPGEADSLLCLDGEYYRAPKSAFIKLRSKPTERQTLELAGPIVACSPDEVLFKRALGAVQQRRFAVARLTLQTLVNTYPDSEYSGKAKQLLADPEIAACGEGWHNPINCDGAGATAPQN
jgi:hypothetical protein